LQTLEFAALAKEWTTQPQQLDVVTAGVSVWRQRIARLSELLRQGTVTAEVGALQCRECHDGNMFYVKAQH
jgi:hypothetical protein